MRSDVLFSMTIGILSLFGHHQRQTRLPQAAQIEIETQPQREDTTNSNNNLK